MESVVLHVESSDVDHGLEIDLSEFYDYVAENELSFGDEFHRNIMEYLIQNSRAEDRTEPDYEPVITNVHLDHMRFTSYIDVTVMDGPEGWHRLGEELEALCQYGKDSKVDDDRLVGYLVLLDDSYAWEAESHVDAIRDRMTSFRGVYGSLSEVVDDLIVDGDLEPVPDYVIHDEEASAEEAERMGYFSSYEVNSWTYAVFI